MSSNLISYKFTLEPILHERYYGSVPLVAVHVAEIDPTVNISDVVKHLNKVAYDESLKHLKRVRKDNNVRIIVGRASDIEAEKLNQFEELGLKNFDVSDVPATQPWTRSQFDECKRTWPVNFHEEKFVKKCLDGTRFSTDDLSRIHEYLGIILDLSRDLKRDVAMVVDGPIIVEKGVCGTSNHPLRHCCVVVINQVANGQVENAPKNGINHDRPYLCTDFDVFVTKEPCLMCSMALLHSRIKRLFFIQCNENRFPLGCPDDNSFSKMRLHVNPKLNHRFEVWKVFFETPNETG